MKGRTRAGGVGARRKGDDGIGRLPHADDDELHRLSSRDEGEPEGARTVSGNRSRQRQREGGHDGPCSHPLSHDAGHAVHVGCEEHGVDDKI